MSISGSRGLKTAYVTGTVTDSGSGGPADPWAEDHSSLVNTSGSSRQIHAVYFQAHTGGDDNTGTIEGLLATRSDFTPQDMYGVGSNSPNNERDEVDSPVLMHWGTTWLTNETSGPGAGLRYNNQPYVDFPEPVEWDESQGLHLSIEVAGPDITEARYILIVYYTD